MLHNESVNVWSHLLGAIFFFLMLPYVVLYMQPPSILDLNTAEKWINAFDVGMLDSEVCFASQPLNNQQCKSVESQLLDDLLRTKWLQSWKNTAEA